MSKFLVPTLLVLWSSVAVLGDEQPNILLIVADDLGYADTGFNGATDLQTPNIDQLAKSGVIFEHGYCNHPYCAPSRAALMSGRYPYRFGFEANPAHDPTNMHLGIDPNETLFPKRLQDTGYKTGIIGKWHLGAAAPFHPNNRGFDYFYGFVGGGHDYFRIDTRLPFRNGYFQPLERNGKPASFDGYLTNALTDDAISFIESSKDHPFFLFLSYNAPHTPLQAPQETIEKYSHIKDHKRKVYAAMVDVMDQCIGSVVEAIDKQGLRENTLIFFLSDNGGPIPMPWNKNFGNGSSNLPLRGGKTNLYEGGIRVPFIASWPGTIPADSKYPHPVISIDIAKTAVEAAGGDAERGNNLEGVNLIPFVNGTKTGPPHEAIFWRGNGGQRWAVISDGKNKLVVDKNNQNPEWFDLNSDSGETNDLSTRQSQQVTLLQQQWKIWNEKNVPAKFENANIYIEKREQFYRNSTIDLNPSNPKK